MKNQNKTPDFIGKNILLGLESIKRSKKYIYFSIGLFFFFVLLALILPVPAEIDRTIRNILEVILFKAFGLEEINLIAFIFNNNLNASVIGLFAGIFFGIVPLIFAISNGYMLGYVIKNLIAHLGFFNGTLSLWRLLPHGIFELPAIFISIGIGLRLGFSLILALNNSDFRIFWSDLKDALRVLVLIIIPLLVLAAIIEGSLMILLG
ncbi:MAG: stage II sporulation protein M [Nanoarchaeota archaeon]